MAGGDAELSGAAASALDRPGLRLLGALLGAALASAVLVAGYVLGSIPAVERALGLRFLLGPNGFPIADPLGTALAWAAGPLAALVAGWIQSPRVAARRPWAGLVMGAETYLLGIVVGVIGLAVIDPLINGSLAPIDQVAISVMFLPVLGVFMLAPVLVVCMASGIVWAASLRLLTGNGDGAEHRSGPDTSRLGWVLLAVAAGLVGLWVMTVGGFLGFINGGEFVD